MNKLVICVLIYVAVSVDTPRWPDKWKATFNEKMTYPVIGSGETAGTMAYDVTSGQYIVDRANGKWDRYCGSVYKFRNLRCTHYVSEGKRYLDFPEKNYCCYCCDAAHGCGILKPDWMSDAAYEG